MVILIGGTGCTGKTLFASQLMRKTNIPYFPLDHLMMGLYRGLPNCGFTPMDGQLVLGEKMWPVIKGMIMTNIENEHNIILEGVQLLPQLLHDFPAAYPEHILPVFLFFSEQYIHENFERKIMKYRSAIESRGDSDELTAAKLLRDAKQLKEQCLQNEIVFFEVEVDYDAKMKEAESYLLAQINQA